MNSDPSHFGYNETTHQFVIPPSSGRPELTFYASRATSDDNTIGDVIRVTPIQIQTNPPTFIIDKEQRSRTTTLDLAAGTRFRLPLATVFDIQSSLSMGFDYKEHTLVNPTTNTFYTETINYGSGHTPQSTNYDQKDFVTGSPTYVSYVPLFFGWDGARADKWGQFSGGVSASASLKPFVNGDSFANMAGTTEADGKFFVAKANFGREQRLFRNWTLSSGASGQWANEPLLTTEQFGIGGNATVRGYQEGERYGDTGWASQLELKSPPTWLSPKELSVSFSVFTDYGQSFSLNPNVSPSSQDLWGAGLGMNLFFLGHLQGRVCLAWPLLDSVWRKAGQERVTFSVSGQF